MLIKFLLHLTGQTSVWAHSFVYYALSRLPLLPTHASNLTLLHIQCPVWVEHKVFPYISTWNDPNNFKAFHSPHLACPFWKQSRHTRDCLFSDSCVLHCWRLHAKLDHKFAQSSIKVRFILHLQVMQWRGSGAVWACTRDAQWRMHPCMIVG